MQNRYYQCTVYFNKDSFLAQEIKTNNLNLTLIMETWLNDTPEDTSWLHQSNLIQLGHAISMHNRPSRGGGIALPYKDVMKAKKIETQCLHGIEYAIWQMSLKNKTIAILGIYHPLPKQDQTMLFNKDSFLAQEIKTNNLNLTLIMETWLNDTPEDTSWLHQSNLIQLGHAISMHNRPSRGGGIALPYKDVMKVKKIEANAYME